jgi:hypothetical protein
MCVVNLYWQLPEKYLHFMGLSTAAVLTQVARDASISTRTADTCKNDLIRHSACDAVLPTRTGRSYLNKHQDITLFV